MESKMPHETQCGATKASAWSRRCRTRPGAALRRLVHGVEDAARDPVRRYKGQCMESKMPHEIRCGATKASAWSRRCRTRPSAALQRPVHGVEDAARDPVRRYKGQCMESKMPHETRCGATKASAWSRRCRTRPSAALQRPVHGVEDAARDPVRRYKGQCMESKMPHETRCGATKASAWSRRCR